MEQGLKLRIRSGLCALAMVAALAGSSAMAQVSAVSPSPAASPTPAASPAATPTATASGAQPSPNPAPSPSPLPTPSVPWTVADARALLAAIQGIGAEGLFPADYKPAALSAAIAKGPGAALDTAATQAFAWLVEDLRDGRTPMTARVQWFALDHDQDQRPTDKLMAEALLAHDVAGVLASLAPTHPDYQALKDELAATPAANKPRLAMLRANMDRWRWLSRDLGEAYLLTNVPEFQLRLTVDNDKVGYKIIRTYRTVVGKPGKTATPQLAEKVEAVVFNPTWTVPQSIVKGEGLGPALLANPARAKRENYKVSRGPDGTISVVQGPGPGNALGLMKIDMPNPHAIYLHDTPSKSFFNMPVRAYSHGCVRTERAVELGMTMAMLGAGMAPEEAAELSRAGEYRRVVMTTTFPVYITYFTMGRSIDGDLRVFGDIYGRDKPVLDSFAQPRQVKTTQRTSNEAIIKLDNPL